MYKFLKNLLCLLLVLFAFSACRKNALNEFYGKPATLAPPLYQTLQARGNFVNFLACIDKAGYTSTLSTAGYWTLFAPNDDAFKKYFAANGITSVSQISTATATQIVTYALVYSGYVSSANGNLSGATLDAIQPITSAVTTTGVSVFLTSGFAYKRKTVYHEGIYQDTVPNFPNFGTLAGQKEWLVSQNRNTGYDYTDFNNKYIPYFTQTYFSAYGLNASDYTYFYPNSTFTNSESNFNVLDGNVVNANIICENGVLQEINTVPVPLPSIEKYLYTHSNYSHFYQFIQRYGGLVNYVPDANATHLNQIATGTTGTVYCKQYSTLLAYSLPNENYLAPGGGTLDPQGNGWTFIAPNNAAFDAYVKNVLLEHYTSLSLLPQNVIVDFINAHMAQETVWPSKFSLSTNLNFNKENFRIDPYNDVVDKVICSNGMFYGSTKVQATNVFSTVFGRPYLDPAYSIMTRMLTFYNYKINLSSPSFRYTIIMVPDATLAKLGYSLNQALEGASPAQSGLTFTNPATGAVSTGATVDNGLLRTLNLGIYTTQNNELNNVTTSGIYATAGLGGMAPEYVKFQNNQFTAAGNQDTGTPVTVNPNYVTTTNGTVYYPAAGNNNILTPTAPIAPSTSTVGTDIFNKGQIPPAADGTGGDPYYYFYKFLSNSTVLWNSTTRTIQGISLGTDYTVFIPSNAAMLDAVNNGWLPSTGTGAVKTPNFAPTATSDVNLVTNFIKYHILNGVQVVPDAKKSGQFATQLFSLDGNGVSVTINSPAPDVMSITDGQGRVANVGKVATATLADHVVIQSIDTYLQFLDYTAISAANPNPTKY